MLRPGRPVAAASLPVTAAIGDRPANGLEPLLALRGGLVRFLRARVREPDVDDLVQDVFLKLVQRGDFATIAAPRAYLFETARNVLRDRGAADTVRHRRAHVPFEAELVGDSAPAPDRILIARQELAAALAILQAMPARTRAVFVLRRLEGMPFKAIAERLGLSVSAVEKHLARGMARLVEGVSARA